MGFFDWLSKALGFGKKSTRETEELQGLKIGRKIVGLNKEQIEIIESEKKDVNEIIVLLEKVKGALEHLQATAKYGVRMHVDPNLKENAEEPMLIRTITVLVNDLRKVLEYNVSIRQEQGILKNLEQYWFAVRRGLNKITVQSHLSETNVKMQDKVSEKTVSDLKPYSKVIDVMFEKLGVHLTAEQELTEGVMKFINEEHALATEEIGAPTARA